MINMIKFFATKKLYLFVFALILLAGGAFSACRQINLAAFARIEPGETAHLKMLKLPDGYRINFFAPPSLQVESPRQLAEGADGWIFSGSRAGKVYALRDGNGDGAADEVRIIAGKMSTPHGVAFYNGGLYIGAVDGVYLIADIITKLADGSQITPRRLISGFHESGHHGTRHLKIAPDGMLYVSLGTPCDICEPPLPGFTSVIRRYALDGDDGEVYARGIRNSVGFDFHPRTGELWFTDNGRDWLGDDLPEDELNHAPRAGIHFGYPYCHQGDLPDPEFGAGKSCADYEPPALLTGAHVANLGMAFDGEGRYVYIALHGSWNRSEKTGYAVYRAEIGEDGGVSGYAPFVEGWLREDGAVLGRPADVVFLADGNMLISDDFSGAIYRISKTL